MAFNKGSRKSYPSNSGQTHNEDRLTEDELESRVLVEESNFYAPITAVNPIQVIRTSGNFNAAVSAAWADLDPGGTAAARPLDVVLPGMAVDDGFDFKPNVTVGSVTGGFLMNLAIIKAGAVHRRLFSATYGFFPWSASSGQAKDIFSPIYRQTVLDGDLEANGSLRLRLQYIQATNARAINASADIPLVLEGRGPFV